MAAKAKGIGVVGLVVVVLVIWWLMRDESTAAALSADIAGGKQVQIPSFGTDNIIDAADAVAVSGSLPLPSLSAPTSTNAYTF